MERAKQLERSSYRMMNDTVGCGYSICMVAVAYQCGRSGYSGNEDKVETEKDMRIENKISQIYELRKS